jgi:hypothetical protein
MTTVVVKKLKKAATVRRVTVTHGSLAEPLPEGTVVMAVCTSTSTAVFRKKAKDGFLILPKDSPS